MRAAPFPSNEPERLHALRGAMCAYAPREERFDRVTRTLRRLLHVPIALISIVESDHQWFRSVQGLSCDHHPRDISFCGHVVASGRPLVIRDTWTDEAFVDNPLVIGPPGIRSYVGWPLEIAPGLVAGTLCAIDTIPRVFSKDELAGLKDLAAIAEGELRAQSMASLQKTLLTRLDMVQRRHALDAVTGCWSIRGFRQLLGLAVQQASAEKTQLALCHLAVHDMDGLASTPGEEGRSSVLAVVAQLLRERLPPEGALARLSGAEFCALVPARTPLALDHLLAPVRATALQGVMPDGRQLDAQMMVRTVKLADMGADATANRLWAAALSAGA